MTKRPSIYGVLLCTVLPRAEDSRSLAGEVIKQERSRQSAT